MKASAKASFCAAARAGRITMSATAQTAVSLGIGSWILTGGVARGRGVDSVDSDMPHLIRRSFVTGVLALAVLAPETADAQIRFVDVAEPTGLTLLNVSGTPAKDFVVDAN